MFRRKPSQPKWPLPPLAKPLPPEMPWFNANAFSLFLRRMRAPLLVLICAYAVSIGGLVLVPGQDDQGNLWYFDFFHAFYFVSFMGTTIGFGEIPYEFTDAQRMWVTVCVFITVISWLYAIGKILALVQDSTFQRAVREQRLTSSVRSIDRPFFIICGYGETGSLLVQALANRDVQTVVVEEDQTKVDDLDLDERTVSIPRLCGKADDVKHLREAGIELPNCAGVVAVTNDDNANVKVAISSRLLNQTAKIVCRARSPVAAANMASFKTDHIINPFDVFAEHLALALKSPSIHLLHAWLGSLPNKRLKRPTTPPRGPWIICGYGRFGKALHKHLEAAGMPVTIIEILEERAPVGAIMGHATEAEPLEKAGISEAAGIIAATRSDADNLSIMWTARTLNPNIYLVARQTRRSNSRLFQAAGLNLVMEGSRVITWRMLPQITTPLLDVFLKLARQNSEDSAGDVLGRILTLNHGLTPDTWELELQPETALAITKALSNNEEVRLSHLLRHPHDQLKSLACIPLLLSRQGKDYFLPQVNRKLRVGDKILFCAPSHTRKDMDWTLNNSAVLHYVMTGERLADGAILRWLQAKRGKA